MFIDDSMSVFPLAEMQRCMVDSWMVWEDFKPFALRPLGYREVWIGYDPSHTGDNCGCIVLAPDGELYELEMGQDIAALALDQTDPVALREERLKKLEELHPRDYVVYAYAALTRVVELLLERRPGG